MQTVDIHTDPEIHSDHFLIPDALARAVEKIKLQHRAEKYQYKEDRGGIAYIKRSVRPGNTVFDIGAHKAGYLFFFREQLGTTGKIFAFEPQSVLYKYLARLQHLLQWNNLTVEAAAVSETCGTATLCVPQNKGRHSSPCATIVESLTPFAYQWKEEVKTIALDDYCKNLQLAPDFLKVDVEGNEFSVFKGAEQTLRKYKPRILFESEARFVGEDRVKETFDLLQHIGYKGYFIQEDRVSPIEAFEIETHQQWGKTPYCNNFIFE